MDIRRYLYTSMIVVVQLSEGRPVADKISLPLIEGAPPTSITSAVGHISTAAFLSGFKPSGTGTSVPLSKRSDSDTTVAIPTIVGIVVLLILFIVIQSFLWSIANHKVNIFTTMQCSVRHPRLISAPPHTACDRVPRTSLRSASPVSDISDASTLCAIPIQEICQPAPVHMKDVSPAHYQ